MEVGNTSENNSKNSNLISVEELVEQLFEMPSTTTEHSEYKLKSAIDPKLVVLDATVGGNTAKENFLEKAIPTARFLNVSQEFKDKSGRFPNTFPTEDVVRNVLQDIGVDITDNIVLYTQPGKTVGATRAFVILKSYGFENVRVLDGGLRKYTEEGYPTVQGKEYEGRKTNLSELANPERYTTNIHTIIKFALGEATNLQLMDTRPANSFNGEATDNVEGCRQGNVPGSFNIPGKEFLNDDDTFKKGEELKEIIEKYNIDPNKKIVSMCRTGMMATIPIVSLNNYNIQLYDGSWSEYGSL